MLRHQDLQDILALLDATEYQQFNLQTDRYKVLIRRSGEHWTATQEVIAEPNFFDSASGAQATAGPAEALSERQEEAEGIHAVRAPLPGVFYRAPKPGAAPFIEVGSRVEAKTEVCIIESMKLMNTLHAGVCGTVTEICVEDGEFADKNTVVIRIEAEAT